MQVKHMLQDALKPAVYLMCHNHTVFLFLGTVSEHTMLLENVGSRPAPTGNSAPVSGVEIMRKLSKSHTHSESGLKIKVWGTNQFSQ